MKKISLYLFVLSCFALTTACKKKFTLPPDKAAPANGGSITIDSLYKKYNNYYLGGPTPTKQFRFSNDVCVTGTVTADEVSGNIYKTVYIQDATGGLQVKLINSGGLFVGDLIRINLNNVLLDDYAKMVQLDSIDIEKKVVKISSGNPVTPTKVSFAQIMAMNNGHSNMQGRLVLLDSVEFSMVYKNRTFADQINKVAYDRTIINYTNTPLTVRTSGYSNFAGKTIPCGKGSVVAVVSQFNSSIQLLIRDFNEVNLAAGVCPYLGKPFDTDGFGEGWNIVKVNGFVPYTIGTYGGASYANITNNINGIKNNCETWLISPALDLSGSTNPVVNFATAAYTSAGSSFQAFVSTNYTSGDPNAATWTNLNPLLSAGSYAWVNSGLISLNPYKTQNVRIGFKYIGTSAGSSTWEMDNFYIAEN
ncbi:MAG: choice-of-anchor J domain-containing protein [Bacteroidetes bacterium]|nr:choice-of-anchor J domain-containing protein [Bacteroidota bacterium]